jgi:hypothetical protein
LSSTENLSEQKSAGIVDENQKDDANKPKLAMVNQLMDNCLVIDKHHSKVTSA